MWARQSFLADKERIGLKAPLAFSPYVNIQEINLPTQSIMSELKLKDPDSIQPQHMHDTSGQLTDVQPGEFKGNIAGYDAVFGELTEDGPQYRSVSSMAL